MKIISLPYPLAKISTFALGVATVSALSVTLPSSKAEALSLVSNINLPDEQDNQSYPLTGANRTGASFQYNLASPTTLTNIQLRLFSSSSIGGTGNVAIDIFNTVVNGLPTGTPIANISQTVSLARFTSTLITFTPSSPISLTPSTYRNFGFKTPSLQDGFTFFGI